MHPDEKTNLLFNRSCFNVRENGMLAQTCYVLEDTLVDYVKFIFPAGHAIRDLATQALLVAHGFEKCTEPDCRNPICVSDKGSIAKEIW